jgi:hypothetical protein
MLVSIWVTLSTDMSISLFGVRRWLPLLSLRGRLEIPSYVL